MVSEEEFFLQNSEALSLDQEERLVEKAVRLADLLAEKLAATEPIDPTERWCGGDIVEGEQNG